MITIYSRNNCAHCQSAKQFLQQRNINFREVNIEQDPQAREFVQSQGHRTVPQIYVGDRLLVDGGWSALSKLSTQEILDRISEINTPINLGPL